MIGEGRGVGGGDRGGEWGWVVGRGGLFSALGLVEVMTIKPRVGEHRWLMNPQRIREYLSDSRTANPN